MAAPTFLDLSQALLQQLQAVLCLIQHRRLVLQLALQRARVGERIVPLSLGIHQLLHKVAQGQTHGLGIDVRDVVAATWGQRPRHRRVLAGARLVAVGLEAGVEACGMTEVRSAQELSSCQQDFRSGKAFAVALVLFQTKASNENAGQW